MRDDDVLHVVPVVDAIAHEVDTEGACVCGPRCDIVLRSGLSDAHIYVHHRLLPDSTPASP